MELYFRILCSEIIQIGRYLTVLFKKMKSWTFLLEFSVGLHVYVLVWTVDTVTLPTVVQPDAAVVTRYTVLRKIIINCVCVSLFVYVLGTPG